MAIQLRLRNERASMSLRPKARKSGSSSTPWPDFRQFLSLCSLFDCLLVLEVVRSRTLWVKVPKTASLLWGRVGYVFEVPLFWALFESG